MRLSAGKSECIATQLLVSISISQNLGYYQYACISLGSMKLHKDDPVPTGALHSKP